MEHCFPRMVAMERDYGGLFKALLAIRKQKKNASPMGPPGTLTTFREGIGALPCAAARQLGDRIRFNCSVRGISRDNEGFVVHLSSGEQYLGKAVLIAAPAFAAADLMHELNPSLARALAEIPYAGLAVVCAGYAREKVAHDMDGFGFLAPRGQAMRMLGCIWTSSLFPFQCPEGRVLVRAMYGGAPDPEALSLSDAALTDLLKQELHPLLHIQGEPEFIRIYRHPKGIPQYTLGHAARLTAVDEAEQAMPGLAITGNAYRGIGLNDCVVSAHRAVEKLLKYLDA
jgi:oxygen-dependent protoporphyrinogen oxidase